MKRILNFIIPIAICFLVAYLSQLFQAESIATWYPTLNKPLFTPPNRAFPIARGILYCCIGASLGFFLNTKGERVNNKKIILSIFSIQLLFNFSWSILFFYMKLPTIAAINIILLDLVVLRYILKTYKSNKVTSLLFVPYLLRLCLASYLNIAIIFLNQ